jgi:hypothetical protein
VTLKTERQQLAEQNEMSLDFVNWFFDEKKESCGNAWFIMAAAMWEGWKGRANREAQPVALVDRRPAASGSICWQNGGKDLPHGTELFTAPPAPAAPDALEKMRSIVADPRALPRRKEWISGQQYSYVLLENVEAMVDEACRAAMLAQPVSGGYKLPDGWIACSEQMPEIEDEYYLTFSASPVGGEISVDFFFDGYFADQNITHWMPLPAAPEGGNG